MSRYGFAVACAFFYGLSPVIARSGLVSGMPQALGTVISTAAVLPIYYAIMVVRQRSFSLPMPDPVSLIFIALAGVTHTMGTLMQFAALKLEYVSVVQSLINLNPLFAVSFLLILGIEKVSRNLIIGTLLVVCGSVLVVTR